jgi:hypothetical protein
METGPRLSERTDFVWKIETWGIWHKLWTLNVSFSSKLRDRPLYILRVREADQWMLMIHSACLFHYMSRNCFLVYPIVLMRVTLTVFIPIRCAMQVVALADHLRITIVVSDYESTGCPLSPW